MSSVHQNNKKKLRKKNKKNYHQNAQKKDRTEVRIKKSKIQQQNQNTHFLLSSIKDRASHTSFSIQKIRRRRRSRKKTPENHQQEEIIL
jgi:hypothetical protein